MPATMSDKEGIQPAGDVYSCNANDKRPVELLGTGKCNRHCEREQLKQILKRGFDTRKCASIAVFDFLVDRVSEGITGGL